MGLDNELVNYIHHFVSDTEIFDSELTWLVATVAVAAAPEKLVKKMPKWIMNTLNAVTLHWKDINKK